VNQDNYLLKSEKYMDIVTLLPDHPYAVDDQLEMTVLFIVDEWNGTVRRSEKNITIKMKTPQIEEEINTTSEDQHFAWQGYEFEYVGGVRQSIQLRIKRTGK
jgi:hypothetical protein